MYKFHNPEYGKKRSPKKDEEEEEVEEGEETGSRRTRGRNRRRPAPRKSAESEQEAEEGTEEAAESEGETETVPAPDKLLDAAKGLFGLKPQTEPAEAAAGGASPTEETPAVVETGPVTVSGTARWGSASTVVDGQEVKPVEIVLSLSGGPATSAVAFGKLRLASFVDQDSNALELLPNPLAGDPRVEFVPFGTASSGATQSGANNTPPGAPEGVNGQVGNAASIGPNSIDIYAAASGVGRPAKRLSCRSPEPPSWS